MPIEEGDVDHDLLPYMRSLMQHRSRLSFVIAGSRRLKEDFWQLVFNAGENMELAALNRRDTERLIREPVQPLVRYDELAVEHIWRATKGHPYLTQLICHRLIQDTDQEGGRQKMITVDQVHRVLIYILEEDDGYLIRLWSELSVAEKQILSTLAELQGPGDEAIPFGALVPIEGDRNLEDSLERLIDQGLVKRQMGHRRNSEGDILGDDAFILANGLWRRWVGNKAHLTVANNQIMA